MHPPCAWHDKAPPFAERSSPSLEGIRSISRHAQPNRAGRQRVLPIPVVLSLVYIPGAGDLPLLQPHLSSPSPYPAPSSRRFFFTAAPPRTPSGTPFLEITIIHCNNFINHHTSNFCRHRHPIILDAAFNFFHHLFILKIPSYLSACI